MSEETISKEDLFKERIEQSKRIEELVLEIERLNSIIKEVREYMERYMFSQKENYDYIHLLGILKGVDKE